MRNRLSIIILASMLMLTGCGDNSTVLNTYNAFVESVNNGDYATAYNYVDTSSCMFMNAEVFEESMYCIDTVFYKAEKAKENKGSWNFITGDLVQTFNLNDDGKLLLPDLITELDLYVPTGSLCSYNGINLNDSMITSSNELETVYTIQAPIAPGVLHIENNLFGSSERTVDPEIGDTNDFSISNEISESIGNAIIVNINNINSALESKNIDTIKDILKGYITDNKLLDNYTQDFISNRKLEDTFTSYHNPVYTISSLKCDLETSSSVDVSASFDVTWEVGEGTTASMSTKGDFVLSNNGEGWTVDSINSWDFMYLTVVGDD